MPDFYTEKETIKVGTAGWSIPKPAAAEFRTEGTHLQRYAKRLPAVEINSSFYRSHKPETYARWAASVPPGFRFAVKVPREITHTRRLSATHDPLYRFLDETQSLAGALGPLLVQLPPRLRFDETLVRQFFDDLRVRFNGAVACEPRHPSWFTDSVEALLRRYQIARVATDPAPVPQAASPGGWSGLIYRRLHGSPRMYYSAYTSEYLDRTVQDIRVTAVSGQQNWCIFDNTALGEATRDALTLLGRLEAGLDHFQPDCVS